MEKGTYITCIYTRSAVCDKEMICVDVNDDSVSVDMAGAGCKLCMGRLGKSRCSLNSVACDRGSCKGTSQIFTLRVVTLVQSLRGLGGSVVCTMSPAPAMGRPLGE